MTIIAVLVACVLGVAFGPLAWRFGIRASGYTGESAGTYTPWKRVRR